MCRNYFFIYRNISVLKIVEHVIENISLHTNIIENINEFRETNMSRKNSIN